MFEVRPKGVQRGLSVGEEGLRKSFHVEGPKTEKTQEPTSGKSDTRNLEDGKSEETPILSS